MSRFPGFSNIWKKKCKNCLFDYVLNPIWQNVTRVHDSNEIPGYTYVNGNQYTIEQIVAQSDIRVRGKMKIVTSNRK